MEESLPLTTGPRRSTTPVREAFPRTSPELTSPLEIDNPFIVAQAAILSLGKVYYFFVEPINARLVPHIESKRNVFSSRSYQELFQSVIPNLSSLLISCKELPACASWKGPMEFLYTILSQCLEEIGETSFASLLNDAIRKHPSHFDEFFFFAIIRLWNERPMLLQHSEPLQKALLIAWSLTPIQSDDLLKRAQSWIARLFDTFHSLASNEQDCLLVLRNLSFNQPRSQARFLLRTFQSKREAAGQPLTETPHSLIFWMRCVVYNIKPTDQLLKTYFQDPKIERSLVTIAYNYQRCNVLSSLTQQPPKDHGHSQ